MDVEGMCGCGEVTVTYYLNGNKRTAVVPRSWARYNNTSRDYWRGMFGSPFLSNEMTFWFRYKSATCDSRESLPNSFQPFRLNLA